MNRSTGAIKMNITFLEGWLGLIHKRPSYRATGTCPSPRSVSEWRSMNRSSSLSSTSRPTLCTHWSLTEHIAPPHWVVTRGRRWLVLGPLCSLTVTRKGSMLLVTRRIILKQESVSLVTNKQIAEALTPESGLVQEGTMTTPTRVETRLRTTEIMEINTSRPWDTYWYSEKKLIKINKKNWSKHILYKASGGRGGWGGRGWEGGGWWVVNRRELI